MPASGHTNSISRRPSRHRQGRPVRKHRRACDDAVRRSQRPRTRCRAPQGLILTEGFYWDHEDRPGALQRALLHSAPATAEPDSTRRHLSAALSLSQAGRPRATKDSEAVGPARLKGTAGRRRPSGRAINGAAAKTAALVHDICICSKVKKPLGIQDALGLANKKQLAVVPGDTGILHPPRKAAARLTK